jgi:hypothetical protein
MNIAGTRTTKEGDPIPNPGNLPGWRLGGVNQSQGYIHKG